MNISKRFKKKTVLEKSLKEEAEYKAQLEALRLENGTSSPPQNGPTRRPLPSVPPSNSNSGPADGGSRNRLGSTSSLSPRKPAVTQEIIYDSGPVSPGAANDNMGVIYSSTGTADARPASNAPPQDLYQTVSKATGNPPPVQPMYQTVSRKPQPAPVTSQPEYRDAAEVEQSRNAAPVYETVEAKSSRMTGKPQKERGRHVSTSSDDVFQPPPADVQHSVRDQGQPPAPTIGRRRRTNSNVDDDDERNNVRRWMKVTMERGDAQAVLERYGGSDGCYLLRKSTGGSFGLSICASNRVFHMKIMMEPSDDFQMVWYIHGDKDDGREFQSLWELLMHYKTPTPRLHWHLTTCLSASRIPRHLQS
eukprot:m.557539 g.557539  ORF g.557539 m.557539 type:complete len:362 (+) comp22190_c0_seq9:196-1281(+)